MHGGDAPVEGYCAVELLNLVVQDKWTVIRARSRCAAERAEHAGSRIDSGHEQDPQRRVGLADDELPADGTTVLSWTEVLKLALGGERPTANITSAYSVGDVLVDYWSYRAAKSPTLSVEIDKSKMKAHVGDLLRTRPVADLTTGELERWLHELVPQTDDREKQRRAQAAALRVWRPFRAALEMPTERAGRTSRLGMRGVQFGPSGTSTDRGRASCPSLRRSGFSTPCPRTSATSRGERCTRDCVCASCSGCEWRM